MKTFRVTWQTAEPKADRAERECVTRNGYAVPEIRAMYVNAHHEVSIVALTLLDAMAKFRHVYKNINTFRSVNFYETEQETLLAKGIKA